MIDKIDVGLPDLLINSSPSIQGTLQGPVNLNSFSQHLLVRDWSWEKLSVGIKKILQDSEERVIERLMRKNLAM
jgi:hypothetical protein